MQNSGIEVSSDLAVAAKYVTYGIVEFNIPFISETEQEIEVIPTVLLLSVLVTVVSLHAVGWLVFNGKTNDKTIN